MSKLKITELNHSEFKNLLQSEAVMEAVRKEAENVQSRISFPTEMHEQKLKGRGSVMIGTDDQEVIYDHDKTQEMIRALTSKK